MAVASACSGKASGPAVAVVGESTRVRIGDPLPASTPWFDGSRVTLVAARGEIIGLQVRHAEGIPVTVAVEGASVVGYAVTRVGVTRPSTAMYGGSHGRGDYADGLVETAAPTTDPAYFELTWPQAGEHRGELAVGTTKFPIVATVAAVAVKPVTPRVWAYEDPKELGDAAVERACIATFRRYGVFLTPDIKIDDWSERKELVRDMPFVPVVVPDDPARVGPVVERWLAAFAGSTQTPFTIPIDEPHTPEARARVKALADAVHAAGGGAGKLVYAVTADPNPELGAIDLYITLHPKLADAGTRWTYNGAPPRAGSMVVDAETPGTRSWGWIGWRYAIPLWYVWDALYWHDRYHGKRALDLADAISFDDGDDRGNLDGVLALPGCVPTLRLAALRRGSIDRQLLELAATCRPDDTMVLAKSIVPVALGDAGERVSWSSDEAVWEMARRKLIELASACK